MGVWTERKKKITKRQTLLCKISRKIAASVSSGQVPKRVERLILVLILIKILLICIYKKGITNTVSRTRGTPPLARWDNIVYWTVWVSLAWHIRSTGSSRHRYGAIKAERGRTHLGSVTGRIRLYHHPGSYSWKYEVVLTPEDQSHSDKTDLCVVRPSVWFHGFWHRRFYLLSYVATIIGGT